MDTLTHALSGMLVGRAIHHDKDRLTLSQKSWIGFLVAAFPDLDFVAGFFGISAFLEYHRGITHSIIMLPLWALLLAWLFAWISNRITKKQQHWQAFYVLCVLALGIHIFGDVITAYGTEVFAPVSKYRLSFPSTFIIDLYFSGIILLAIIASIIFRRHARRIALGGVMALMAYIVLQNYWMLQALENSYASIPVEQLKVKRISALPQPLSPFNWKVIVETEDRYYVRYLNIYRVEAKTVNAQSSYFEKIDALYSEKDFYNWNVILKNGIGPIRELANSIWQHERMASVRRFMEYPAVHRFDQLPDATCVWFADQRFVLGDIRAPFIFGACQHNETREMKFLRWQDGAPASFE